MGHGRRRSALWVALPALIAPPVVAAQPVVEPPPLAVPYLSQSTLLCGGAAVAMVERYWGVRGVRPEDFAYLLDRRREGIDTAALAAAMAARGWRAVVVEGTTELLRAEVGAGRPPIALVSAGARRYHYVVVVGVGADVVYHDPAVRPLERRPLAEFDRRWAASGRWAMIVAPVGATVLSKPRKRQPPLLPGGQSPLSCASAIEDAAARVARHDVPEAESLLIGAQARCPEASAPWRELAALRLVERRTADAVPLAQAAITRDPLDAHAWRVLGTAQFLEGNTAAALDAWNRVGEPVIDLLRVEGLQRTRHRVVTERLAVSEGSLLTPAALARAERRLAAMPALARSHLEVVPVGSGIAELKAAVVERPRLPTSPLAAAALGLSAALNREVLWRVSSATGAGERLDLWARWWEQRPGARVTLHVPVNWHPISGILRLEGGVERETFESDAPGLGVIEDHRTAAIALSDWATSHTRWEGGIRIDRWTGRDLAVGVGGLVEQRMASTTALLAGFTVWPSANIVAARVGGRWRWPSTDGERIRAAVNAVVTSAAAPRALWAGVGTGHGRQFLLRAHPLLDDGVVDDDGIGRTVVHGSVEAYRRVARLGPLALSAAAFADAAAVSRGVGGRDRQLDLGAGVRLRIPGEGTLRVDYAHGLVDGSDALSAGWDLPWPSWP